LVQALFQDILNERVPRGGCIGLRPQILNVLRTTQSRRNQVIDLIVFRMSVGDSVLLKNLLTQWRWYGPNNFLMGHRANLADRNSPRSAWSKVRVGNLPALDCNNR